MAKFKVLVEESPGRAEHDNTTLYEIEAVLFTVDSDWVIFSNTTSTMMAVNHVAAFPAKRIVSIERLEAATS